MAMREGLSAQDRVSGVLFDLDGTLADTEELILRSFRYAVREVIGRGYPDEAFLAKVGQPLATQMWDFADSEAVHGELCRVYREYNARIHDETIARFPGTRAALEQLADAGFPMGVVTSKRREPALKALESCEIGDLLPVVVGSDDCSAHKPDPGPVLLGARMMGVAPEACLYVGDSPFDIQAGNRAGCMTAAALWGMFPEAALSAERPDVLCRSIADVVGLLCP